VKIAKTQDYLDSLKDILSYIAKDKKSVAVAFKDELNKKINALKEFPFMYRASIYFDNENIRDLTYKGYTIPYEVNLKNGIIYIIGITKYKQNLK